MTDEDKCLCCGRKPALPDKAYCAGCLDFLREGNDMSDSGKQIGESYRTPEAQSKIADMTVRAEAAGATETRKPAGANGIQPGGDHYLRHGKGGQEQHWDRMWRLFGPAWFVCNATKYTERAGDKNGLQDIEKALHYLTKLKELVTAWRDGTGPPPGNPTWAAFKKDLGTPDPQSIPPCTHPDPSRILIQSVAGNGWRCDLCGHKESN